MVNKKLRTAIEIRRSKEEDLPGIVSILNDSVDMLSQDKYTLRDIQRILSRGAHFYIAKIEGKIIGCASLERLEVK